MIPQRPRRISRDVAAGATGLAAVALVIAGLRAAQHLPNPTISALLLLLVILITATTVRVGIAIAVAVVATAAFNFFLLPPFHTFSLDDPQHWVALSVFLVVGVVASQLSAAVRARAEEAVGRRDELARLFDLSRDVLVMTARPDAVSQLARSVAHRFDLAFIVIALPGRSGWDIFEAGNEPLRLDACELTAAFEAAQQSLEFDAYARAYAGHRTIAVGARTVSLVPLRAGTKPLGVLAAAGRAVEAGTLDTLAGVVAIAVERMRFLAERETAELTRRSEQLKTALLASLAHDLRTPLTAIRVAAGNLEASWLTADDRKEQSDVVLTEVERLTRLFNNVVEMARIDAGAIEKKARWTHPSEVIAAARDQVEHALERHELTVATGVDLPLQLDARLTSSALAQLLQNAAQYAPRGTSIDVAANVTDEGLTIRVRDHGAGIPAADLPHLFERFYRGTTAAHVRATGSGMGLWIARGLLAAEGGRVWAENCADGGAQFTIVVPAAARTLAEPAS